MPVRLRAFEYVEKKKRPIYLLEQKNEGFYIKLNEARVTEWLSQNGLGGFLPPRDTMRLGGLLIENYIDFGRFLESYRERATPRTPRSIPNYVFLCCTRWRIISLTLSLNTPGLDYGSIGEYLFPARLRGPRLPARHDP